MIYVVLSPTDSFYQLIQELLTLNDPSLICTGVASYAIWPMFLSKEERDTAREWSTDLPNQLINCRNGTHNLILREGSNAFMRILLYIIPCLLLRTVSQAKPYRSRIRHEVEHIITNLPPPTKYLGNNPLVYDGN